MSFSKLFSCEIITNYFIMQLVGVDDRIAIFLGIRSYFRLTRTAYVDRISVFCVSSTGRRSGVPPYYPVEHTVDGTLFCALQYMLLTLIVTAAFHFRSSSYGSTALIALNE